MERWAVRESCGSGIDYVLSKWKGGEGERADGEIAAEPGGRAEEHGEITTSAFVHPNKAS